MKARRDFDLMCSLCFGLERGIWRSRTGRRISDLCLMMIAALQVLALYDPTACSPRNTQKFLRPENLLSLEFVP